MNAQLKRLQCKDIPDRPVMEFLARLERQEILLQWEEAEGKIKSFYPKDGSSYSGFANYVGHGMPAGTPEKLAIAKMGMLIRKGVADGCCCGCRGEFRLTDKGRALLAPK